MNILWKLDGFVRMVLIQMKIIGIGKDLELQLVAQALLVATSRGQMLSF